MFRDKAGAFAPALFFCERLVWKHMLKRFHGQTMGVNLLKNIYSNKVVH